MTVRLLSPKLVAASTEFLQSKSSVGQSHQSCENPHSCKSRQSHKSHQNGQSRQTHKSCQVFKILSHQFYEWLRKDR